MARIPNMKTIPTRGGTGTTVLLVNQAAVDRGRTFVPYWFLIPTTTGTGNRVLQPNSAINGRVYIPEPSVTTTTSKFEGSSIDLPDGYLTKPYAYKWKFLGSGTTISFDSGSIPPGLHFHMIDSVTWEITGIPTLIGVYTFTLLSESVGGSGFLDFVVEIKESEEETGTAYVGGN
jgi:hypothetical protein